MYDNAQNYTDGAYISWAFHQDVMDDLASLDQKDLNDDERELLGLIERDYNPQVKQQPLLYGYSALQGAQQKTEMDAHDYAYLQDCHSNDDLTEEEKALALSLLSGSVPVSTDENTKIKK